jgi:hypothetical protein
VFFVVKEVCIETASSISLLLPQTEVMPNLRASFNFTDSGLLESEMLLFVFSSILLQFSTALPQSREMGMGNNSSFFLFAGAISKIVDGGTDTSETNRSSNLLRLDARDLASTAAAASFSATTPQQIPAISSDSQAIKILNEQKQINYLQNPQVIIN